MNICYWQDNNEIPDNLVMTLGNFDGLHLGHRELIRTTRETARRKKGIPAAFTFDPHPLKVLQPDCCPPMLLTREDKIKMLSRLGIEFLVIAPFPADLARLSPARFVRDVLVDRFRVKAVVVGYNYNFGHRGSGNAAMLAQLAGDYGIETIIVPPVTCDGVEVSSTLVRQLLLEGQVARAASMLGYVPFIESRVVAGDRRGRQIGYPTANIDIPDDILVPANGVYAVRVMVKERSLGGVANIGVKPTFNLNRPKNLEVHIFDFGDDIYGAQIRVEFIDRIRGEREFPSVRELIDQIARDEAEARLILSRAAENKVPGRQIY